MKNKLYYSIILIPLFVASLFGYYNNIAAMKGEGAVSSLGDALAYVEANWQPGDIIFVTDDGPYINLAPYTDKPIYRMPGCEEKGSYAPVLGSLSNATRQVIGMITVSLADIPHKRAWVFAPFSPLHPLCYDDQVYEIVKFRRPVDYANYMGYPINNFPTFIVDNNDWLYSAVWLVEEK